MVRIFYWNDYPQIEKRLADLYDEYGSDYDQINKVLNKEFGDIKEFTLDSTRNRIRRSPIIDYIPNKRGKGIFANLYQDEIVFDYKEVKQHIINVMNRIDMTFGNKEFKVLVINDLHIPFTDIDVLETIIHGNQDADILVIAGDLLDLYSISRYGQSKNIDVSKEYKMGYKIMNELSKIFKQIYVINGNHEMRLQSYFENKIVTGLNGYLMDKHKPLAEICRYFDNVEYINHWFMKINDFYFGHPKRYSSVTMRTVENVIKHIIKNRFEKDFGDFNGVGIGHSHRIGRTESFGRYGYEFGCIMDLDADYRHKDAKGNKWENGYGIVTFKNGKMDYNRTRDILVA